MQSILRISFIFILFSFSLFAQPPYGLTERISNTSFLLSTSGDTLAEMQLRRVFDQISFSRPIYLFNANDGSNRIFVVEKSGVVKVFANDENTSQFTTFLDIQSAVNSSPSEAGLLSVAFHPNYAVNGKFYIYYNYGSLNTRVSEFIVSDNPDVANDTTERKIFEIPQPYSNHNGGQIAFGPDGYLYIGLGDGGSGGDPLNSGQNTQTLLGAMLRIDIDKVTASTKYGVPPDNPFVGDSSAGLPEIWAWGLRNPWRFSFDTESGRLWAGDVGQGAWEEVDIIEGGKNYGWRIMEGTHCYNPSSGCDTTGLTMPVIEYSHSIGKSITGGFVYHGSKQPRLKDVYLYADYVTKKIWGLKYENGQVIENKLIAECPSLISSFGQDENGEVYVVGYDGNIYAFEEKAGNPAPRFIPETISESGLFANIDSLIPSPGIISYSVNSQLWSDGAYKTRYIALPETSKIDFNIEDPWQYPPNAVLVKNFFLELIKGDPQSRKIIETRFLVRHPDKEQWDGFSYMWNDEATDASLLESSAYKSFTITDGANEYQQNYYYPSRSQCVECHTPEAGFVIGVKTSQINKQHLYGDISDNQLRSYNKIGLFTEYIGEDYSAYPKLPDPHDTNFKIEDRARSYLDANCANCHLEGSSGRTNIDFRYDIPLAAAHIVGIPADLYNAGIEGAERIKPGAADSSMVYVRMMDTTSFRMPPMATSIVDEFGTRLIKQWIDSLGVALEIEKENHVVDEFMLYPAYPNPFNPSTVISWQLPVGSYTDLTIYNVLGQKIATLISQEMKAGQYQIEWDAAGYASGIYYYRLSTDAGFVAVKKLILLR
jgi:uncharacterized repeat protein (TIGR03806 family)